MKARKNTKTSTTQKQVKEICENKRQNWGKRRKTKVEIIQKLLYARKIKSENLKISDRKTTRQTEKKNELENK